jgi:hypothetical protein
MRAMRNAAVLVSGGLVAVGATLLAPSAHADEQSFLRAIHSAGIVADDAGALLNAKLTCTWLSNGATPDGAVANMSSGSGLSYELTVVFVAVAMKEFCPQYLKMPNVPMPTPTPVTPAPRGVIA